jgi:arylsulfatase A-like enzyme
MPGSDLSRPNILFILTDDQGYWAMGCAGNAEIYTPNLDRLAAGGMRFENFFCASPVCSPARASILTGRIPSQHGIHDFLRAGNATVETDHQGELIEYLKGQPAYTETLVAAGYTCGLSGKWHLGDSHRPQKGFTFWNVHALGAGPYYNAPMIKQGQVYHPEGYVSDVITDNALEFLDSCQGSSKPFCLHVHYTAPHAPWDREHHPPELYDDYFNNCPFESTPDLPVHPQQLYKPDQVGRNEAERRAVLSGYYAAVTAMDANVGRLLDWLEANGLRENTVIVFSSDNGMSMGHHGIYGKGNGTFPVNMFDTAVKVPTLISRPGHVPQGAVCDALLSHYDLMPTLLDYLGLPHPAADSLPGTTFAPLLRGAPAGNRDHIVVFDEYGPARMIRNKEWKYIHRYPYGPNELYHLAEDPDEAYSLIASKDYQFVKSELLGQLESWFVRYVDPMLDGSLEAVMGRGQLNLAGPQSQGQQRFADDLVYDRDRPGVGG